MEGYGFTLERKDGADFLTRIKAEKAILSTWNLSKEYYMRPQDNLVGCAIQHKQERFKEFLNDLIK